MSIQRKKKREKNKKCEENGEKYRKNQFPNI